MMLDATIGSRSGPPAMPNSVSTPRTFAMAIELEVLAGADVLDRSATLDVGLLAVDKGPDEDDTFTLLARDARPVVGVGGVGKILVLAVLLANRFEQVRALQSTSVTRDLTLDREFLGAPHDVLDHGARREVLEVQDLLVTALVGDFEESVLVVDAVHVGDRLFDHDADGLVAIAAAELVDELFVDWQVVVQVALEDLRRGVHVGSFDLDPDVEAPRTQDRRVDEILAVGGADDDHVAQRLHTVDLGEQLGYDRRLHVRTDAGAASAKQRVHLVEEDNDRHALFGLLSGSLEHQTNLTFGLAHVLVEQFRALDVQEIRTDVAIATEFTDLGRERVRDGLGDERLATTRWTVEQDPLRRGQFVVLEECAVQIGQLDRVGDRLDLGVQAADVGVRDVGHLLEDEFLGLLAHQALGEEIRTKV